ALEPLVPPAQCFLQKPDLRAGFGEVWILVCPGPNQSLRRAFQMREHARDRVGVAVSPAADRTDRPRDRAPILADRAVFPYGVAALMLQAVGDQQRLVFQPVQPDLAPLFTKQPLVGCA